MLIGSDLSALTRPGSRRHPRLPAAVVIGLSAITVAACSGTGAAVPRSLPPLHSATPPEALPHGPGVVAAKSPAGVVRRYYAALNHLHERMDPHPLAALFTRDCTCQAQVRAVGSARSKGLHYIDQVHLLKLTTTRDSHQVADVLVSFDAGAGGLENDAGHSVTSARPAKDVHRDFVLRRTGRQWKIARIVVA